MTKISPPNTAGSDQGLRWTGERYVPWVKDAALHYEHLHRYGFAARFAAGGARVLDMACGEGYGSALLAASAASVVGFDLDSSAIAHARRRYGREADFFVGSILSVALEPDSFDLVACFEAIEHVEDHQALVQEVKRVLKPGGLAFVSTPNREVYSEENEEDNPFHVKELNLEEFVGLLGSHFEHVAVRGQHVLPGSYLFDSGAEAGVVGDLQLVRQASEGFSWSARNESTMRYFVAVVSDQPIPTLPQSLLLDLSGAKFAEGQQALRQQVHLEGQIRDRDQALAKMANYQSGLKSDLEELEQRYRELQKVAEEREGGLADAEKAVSEARAYVQKLEASVETLEGQYRSVEKSFQTQSGAYSTLEDRCQQVEQAFGELEKSYKELETAHLELSASRSRRGFGPLGK